jgi:hypothetical protein
LYLLHFVVPHVARKRVDQSRCAMVENEYAPIGARFFSG